MAGTSDLNRDGFADLAIGASAAMDGAGRVHVYLGSATGFAATPATSLTGPDGAGGGFGWSVAGAGDIDGDGFGDIVVGAPATSGLPGRAHIYPGTSSAVGSTPSSSLTGPDGAGGSFGFTLN